MTPLLPALLTACGAPGSFGPVGGDQAIVCTFDKETGIYSCS